MKRSWAWLIAMSVLYMLPIANVQAQNTAASTTTSAYRYAQHGDFEIFYADFKQALNKRDQSAVFKMTHMPFMCEAMECGALVRDSAEDYDSSQDLSMRNKTEFLQKYDQVFTIRLPDLMRGRFMSLNQVDEDDVNTREFYTATEQVLQSFYQLGNESNQDIFRFELNEQGKYQLHSIPYRP